MPTTTSQEQHADDHDDTCGNDAVADQRTAKLLRMENKGAESDHGDRNENRPEDDDK